VFAALDQVARPQLLAGLAVLVGLVTATWLRSAAPEWSPDLFAWPMAASLLCAPVVFPWYLLWLLPFLTSASTLLIIVWYCEHYPHLRYVALAHTWASVGAASWLGNAAGIRTRGRGQCNSRFAPDHTIGRLQCQADQ